MSQMGFAVNSQAEEQPAEVADFIRRNAVNMDRLDKRDLAELLAQAFDRIAQLESITRLSITQQ